MAAALKDSAADCLRTMSRMNSRKTVGMTLITLRRLLSMAPNQKKARASSTVAGAEPSRAMIFPFFSTFEALLLEDVFEASLGVASVSVAVLAGTKFGYQTPSHETLVVDHTRINLSVLARYLEAQPAISPARASREGRATCSNHPLGDSSGSGSE